MTPVQRFRINRLQAIQQGAQRFIQCIRWSANACGQDTMIEVWYGIYLRHPDWFAGADSNALRDVLLSRHDDRDRLHEIQHFVHCRNSFYTMIRRNYDYSSFADTSVKAPSLHEYTNVLEVLQYLAISNPLLFRKGPTHKKWLQEHVDSEHQSCPLKFHAVDELKRSFQARRHPIDETELDQFAAPSRVVYHLQCNNTNCKSPLDLSKQEGVIHLATFITSKLRQTTDLTVGSLTFADAVQTVASEKSTRKCGACGQRVAQTITHWPNVLVLIFGPWFENGIGTKSKWFNFKDSSFSIGTRSYRLTGLIFYKPGHYTAEILRDKAWYYYDGLANDMTGKAWLTGLHPQLVIPESTPLFDLSNRVIAAVFEFVPP